MTIGEMKFEDILDDSSSFEFGIILRTDRQSYTKNSLKMVVIVEYIQAFYNHLNQVISNLRDELGSHKGSQYCFLAVKVSSMMTNYQNNQD